MARWEFEAIYKAFSRMVYWAAYGVTKSESDAGDVTQETFIRALKYADKLKDMEEAQIKAWLYRVCINLCMDRRWRICPIFTAKRLCCIISPGFNMAILRQCRA